MSSFLCFHAHLVRRAVLCGPAIVVALEHVPGRGKSIFLHMAAGGTGIAAMPPLRISSGLQA
ncbi:hypothetical protein DK847_13215 [Aestuariivirga litoralis]|uniref:Uncharacterized protein n=1 Tax=Aestuariivirga litoralis TaxID=2650924 RepID=A0A2W2B760_9HYPH|nr:hypothetical protein DK847_13215 [Aestuariivirga litoralis]